MSCYAEPGRVKKIIAYDVEFLPIASGMSSWPQWCHEDVVSPTWQYGLVSVESYDEAACTAKIKGTLVNSLEHVNLVTNDAIKDLKHDERAQFQ